MDEKVEIKLMELGMMGKIDGYLWAFWPLRTNA